MSIYEVHAGSWRRHPDGRRLHLSRARRRACAVRASTWATRTSSCCRSPSIRWTSRGATRRPATSRRPAATAHRTTCAHSSTPATQAGIGVLLDWVPAHFPRDAWALARFDGTALYEHADPRLGLHPDWGTHIFNYGRNEVRVFLLSSAHYWLAEFHFDGLRVDAVASMLYLDYSRKPGEWIPNRHGGRENLEAIDFLRELNAMVHAEFPGALTIAEESTAWPMVSRPVLPRRARLLDEVEHGLDARHARLLRSATRCIRRFHHNQLTFGQLYAYTENFVLPLSHDEVVHGKALAARQDAGRRLAAVRQPAAAARLPVRLRPARSSTSWASEFGAVARMERASGARLGPARAGGRTPGVQRLVRDLNRLLRATPRAARARLRAGGLRLDRLSRHRPVGARFLRCARDGAFVVVALNFTPVPRSGYRIGVPAARTLPRAAEQRLDVLRRQRTSATPAGSRRTIARTWASAARSR